MKKESWSLISMIILLPTGFKKTLVRIKKTWLQPKWTKTGSKIALKVLFYNIFILTDYCIVSWFIHLVQLLFFPSKQSCHDVCFDQEMGLNWLLTPEGWNQAPPIFPHGRRHSDIHHNLEDNTTATSLSCQRQIQVQCECKQNYFEFGSFKEDPSDLAHLNTHTNSHLSFNTSCQNLQSPYVSSSLPLKKETSMFPL